MESSNSMSSCESLYSVDSAASDDEDKCYDFSVFLSDSESELEKMTNGSSGRRGTFSRGKRILFSAKSEWTSPSLPGQDCKRRTLRPTLQSSARQRPSSQCGRFPGALEGRYPSARTCLIDGDRSLAGRTLSQKRMESGWKHLICPAGEREYPEYGAKPTSRGIKRQRNGEAEMREAPRSPLTAGDQLFAQKCRELQGFIRPLMELLNGLKKGRYERGLSSFQRSVAMDRIQRIVGVLQKPEMGERYLGTLLQVETMLKVWFPHIALNSSCPDSNTAENARKLAKQPHPKPSAADSSIGEQAVPSEDSAQSPPAEKLHHTRRVDPAAADSKAGAAWREQARFLADWSAMNLTWMHTSPICNPPLGLANLGHLNTAFSQALLGPNPCGVILFLHNNLVAPAPFFRSTSVTPTKSFPASSHPKQPPGMGEPPRCQSLPGAMAGGSYVIGQRPGSHSKSLPHLPTSGKEPQEAAAWTGNGESELLVRKGPVYYS